MVSRKAIFDCRRSSGGSANVQRAASTVVDVEGLPVEDGLTMGTVLTEDLEGSQPELPTTIYEGSEEVKPDDDTARPAGRGSDEENPYFWKMSKDKRTIDVVFPIDEDVSSDDVIYRLGDDVTDSKRGPLLEMGWKYFDDNGRKREKLVLDGQLLNAVRREDCMWTIEDMAGVRVVVLTLTRPSMIRQRHDPILKTKTQEERIEPQTWDAIFVEERVKPQITDRVFFDLSLDGEPAARMELGLYGDTVPNTVMNFLALVTGRYEDADGDVKDSAFCYKGTRFQTIMENFFAGFGNPGLDHLTLEMSHEELAEYTAFMSDFRMQPKTVGMVKKDWAIRWGGDLGTPNDADGNPRHEGQSINGNSEEELESIVARLRELESEGKGAKLIFFRPEYEKGITATGGTFEAENFILPHCKRGTISMDRGEDSGVQGSNVFITFKEFPEMDKRWSVFGEVINGFDVLDKIEKDCDGEPSKVLIKDCGLLQ